VTKLQLQPFAEKRNDLCKCPKKDKNKTVQPTPKQRMADTNPTNFLAEVKDTPPSKNERPKSSPSTRPKSGRGSPGVSRTGPSAVKTTPAAAKTAPAAAETPKSAKEPVVKT
jgi:hypothetical protein